MINQERAGLVSVITQVMSQAICTRYELSMGAKSTPIVRVLLVLFFPAAYPIS
jgi:metal transporter CNNM